MFSYRLLIDPVLQGVGDDECLIKCDVAFLVIAFDESLLVEDPLSVFRCVLQYLDVIFLSGSFQFPPRRIKTPLLQLLFEFFYGLCRNETALPEVIESAVRIR